MIVMIEKPSARVFSDCIDCASSARVFNDCDDRGVECNECSMIVMIDTDECTSVE